MDEAAIRSLLARVIWERLQDRTLVPADALAFSERLAEHLMAELSNVLLVSPRDEGRALAERLYANEIGRVGSVDTRRAEEIAADCLSLAKAFGRALGEEKANGR